MSAAYRQAHIEYNKDKREGREDNLKKYFRSLNDSEQQELLQHAKPGTDFGEKLFKYLTINSATPELRKYDSETLLDWINKNIHANASANTKLVKEKLLKIFPPSQDWDIVDPPGDGFCTLYAAMIDSELPIIDKDYIIQLLIKGTKDYFKYEESVKGDKSIVIEFDPDAGDYGFISPNTSDRELVEIFNKLKKLPNTPTQIISLLIYALNTNILLLSYDPRSEIPYLQTYYKNENPDPEIYSQIENKNTILFLYNGHTFLLHNKDKGLKLVTVERLLQNRNLWQGMPSARGVTKRKKRITKGKKTRTKGKISKSKGKKKKTKKLKA